MPTASIDAHLPDGDLDVVFARFTDFSAYPACSDLIREVVVSPPGHGVATSRWAVNFRNGVLSWTEQDHIDTHAHRVDFAQIDGDFEALEGAWQLAHDGNGGVSLRFHADFDLGIPTLAPLINPLAERAFTDTIRSALIGLLGDQVRTSQPA